MNYIVLDLEWNQCSEGKDNCIKEMPFEIFEIGAVKLDENRHFLDSFSIYIRPQVYTELHFITKDLTHVSKKDLESGVTFTEAADEFFKWCGKDFFMCTWGISDLYELQRNMRYYDFKSPFEFPLKFYDIQKLYSIEKEDGKSRRSLEYAVDELGIEKKNEFHTAIADAKYTAKVFEALDFSKSKTYFSIDNYYIPTKKSEEIFVNFGTYSKYISRGFATREEAAMDRDVLSTNCYLCGKTAKKKIRWFTVNSKMHYCLCECKEHGLLKGRYKIREDEFGQFYATKVMKLTDEAGAEEIRKRQLDMRKKRYEKRHRQ